MYKSFNKIHKSFKKFNQSGKYFLVFNVFSNNKSIEFLMQKKFIGFTYFKIHKFASSNEFYVTVEFDLKHYAQFKTKIFKFLETEDFNFNFVGVLINNNFVLQNFFEQKFLTRIKKYDSLEEIFYYLFINLLNYNVFNYKLIFIFYYYILVIQNFVKLNVYRTPSSI